MQSLANGLDEFLVVVLALLVYGGSGWHRRVRRHQRTSRRIVVNRSIGMGELGLWNGHGRTDSSWRRVRRGTGRRTLATAGTGAGRGCGLGLHRVGTVRVLICVMMAVVVVLLGSTLPHLFTGIKGDSHGGAVACGLLIHGSLE